MTIFSSLHHKVYQFFIAGNHFSVFLPKKISSLRILRGEPASLAQALCKNFRTLNHDRLNDFHLTYHPKKIIDFPQTGDPRTLKMLKIKFTSIDTNYSNRGRINLSLLIVFDQFITNIACPSELESHFVAFFLVCSNYSSKNVKKPHKKLLYSAFIYFYKAFSFLSHFFFITASFQLSTFSYFSNSGFHARRKPDIDILQISSNQYLR